MQQFSVAHEELRAASVQSYTEAIHESVIVNLKARNCSRVPRTERPCRKAMWCHGTVAELLGEAGLCRCARMPDAAYVHVTDCYWRKADVQYRNY